MQQAHGWESTAHERRTLGSTSFSRIALGAFVSALVASVLASCSPKTDAEDVGDADGILDSVPSDAAETVAQDSQSGGPCRLPDGSPRNDGTACDDGRVCTVGDYCKAGACVSGTQTCPCEPAFVDCAAPSEADAANACLGPLYCAPQPATALQPFACLRNHAFTKVCDDSLDSACQKNACGPSTGTCALTPTERTTQVCDLPPPSGGAAAACRIQALLPSQVSAAAVACDDGLACSKGDHCEGGVCGFGDASACHCKVDADCTDDGNLCNGKPYCDTNGVGANQQPDWTCKINPATVVSCDQSDVGACAQTACVPATGVCSLVNLAVGSACDDGVACTKGDVCDGEGACKPGTWACCKVDSDCASFDDGDVCNGSLYCNTATGVCETNPATKIVCPSADDTTCLQAQCVKATGACVAKPVNAGGACSDGDICTLGEVCTNGECLGGVDNCPCQEDADCTSKEDGNFCNGTMFCNKALGQCKVNPKTVVSCPTVDDTGCRKAQCQPKTGACLQVDLPAGATCEADGSGCTVNDTCDGKGGCDIGLQVCVCLNDADCEVQEDGNPCNGTLYCDKSGPKPACKVNPATVKVCATDADTACRKASCVPATGSCALADLETGAPCDDGDACTVQETCDGKGGCVGGVAICVCTKDSDCGEDDGDPCNGKDVCSKGVCAKQPPPICDDGNACTNSVCAPTKGCIDVPNEATCTIGDGCSIADVCDTGVCKAGIALTCDDGASCTNDSCVPGKGCVFKPAATCGDASCDCGEHSGNCASDCPPVCVNGPPAAIVFAVEPGDGKVGELLPKVVVQIRDAKGGLCQAMNATVSLQIDPAAGVATLGGKVSLSAVGGVATFDALTMTAVGKAWRLRALTAGLVPAVSAPFAIAVGAPKQLAFVQQPFSAIAGVAIAPAPSVAVQDVGGNVVTTAFGTVTLGIQTGPSGAKLQGGSAAIQQGVATFAGVVLQTAGAYALQASALGLQATSGTFAISAAAPEALTSALQASPAQATADGVAAVTLTATLRDAFGNPTAKRPVVLAATGPGVTLTQPAAPTDDNGVTKGAVRATKAGELTVSMLVSGKDFGSAKATFVGGTPASGHCALTPSGTAEADGSAAVELALVLKDAFDNPAANATLTLVADPADGISFDQPAASDASGKTTAKVRATVAGTVQVSAMAGGKVVASASVTFTAGSAAQLAFTSQPPPSFAADAGGFAVNVEVRDAVGNLDSSATQAVTLSIKGGTAGALLEGTATVSAVKGVASFSGLVVHKAGSGYQLEAKATGLKLSTSEAFAVTAGPAKTVVFTKQPKDTTVGALMEPAIVLSVADAWGNPDADGTAAIRLWLDGWTGAVPMGLQYTFTAKPGVPVSWTQVRLPAAGTFKLRAVATGYDDVVSESFVVKDASLTEVCNGKDDDDNGLTDEGCDDDNDGSCNAMQIVAAGATCSGQDDCNDGNKAVKPGVADVCDGIDNGCALLPVTEVAALGAATALTSLAASSQYVKRIVAPSKDVRLLAARVPVLVTADAVVTLALSTGTVNNGNAISSAVARSSVTLKASATDRLQDVWFTFNGNPADELAPTPFLPKLAAGKSYTLFVVRSSGTVLIPSDADGLRAQIFTVAGDPDAGCDDDGDGYCDKAMTVVGGAAICGKSLPGKGDDCDDTVANTHPDSAETCNNVDDDCDGKTDQQPICDDVNECTSDGCISATGTCTHTAVPNGTACENGSCGGGQCVDNGAKAVEAGPYHACAILKSGHLRCWGGNSHGQIGVAGPNNQATPATVPLPAAVADVAAGYTHTCAALVDGSVYCWGRNYDGQLGNGTNQDSVTPVQALSASAGALEVSAGSNFSCARLTGGKVRCWGGGILGNGGTTGSKTPVDVSGLSSGVKQISSGQIHSCAVLDSGGVRCWGSNNGSGLLGGGDSSAQTTPVNVVGLASGVLEVIVGGQGSCARLAKEIRCWGTNTYGQLGNGGTQSTKTPVSATALGTDIASFAFSGYTTCVVDSKGVTRCLGLGSYGALGDGGTANKTSPTVMTVLGGASAQLSLNIWYGCALLQGGVVRCWGRNDLGQLGAGIDPAPLVPVDVLGLSGVAEVAAGYHACARLAGGTVQCWGYNNAGQIGDGTTEARESPTTVSTLGADSVAIATGKQSVSCAISKTGAMRCWGDNTYGQLGIASSTKSATKPTQVAGLTSGVTAMSIGANHTCAVRLGAAYCWGYNSQGQLGDGGTTNRTSAYAVQTLSADIAEVSAGTTHSCARTTAGAVSCWGYNSLGQLGDGTTTQQLTPVAVQGLPGPAKAVATTGTSSCALLQDGQVACWGSNNNGELGDGTQTASSKPVVLAGLGKGNLGIAANLYNVCALNGQSGVLCWGRNDYGQIGDGTKTMRLSPTSVVGLGSGVSALSAGGMNACALVGGKAKCWGYNVYGGLGDNSGWRLSAVPVVGIGP